MRSVSVVLCLCALVTPAWAQSEARVAVGVSITRFVQSDDRFESVTTPALRYRVRAASINGAAARASPAARRQSGRPAAHPAPALACIRSARRGSA
jgi:hypothetical protein